MATPLFMISGQLEVYESDNVALFDGGAAAQIMVTHISDNAYNTCKDSFLIF